MTITGGGNRGSLLVCNPIGDGVDAAAVHMLELEAEERLDVLTLDGRGADGAVARIHAGEVFRSGFLAGDEPGRNLHPFFAMLNPSQTENARLLVHFWSDPAGEPETYSVELAPMGSWRGSLKDINPDYLPGESRSVTWESEGALKVDATAWESRFGEYRLLDVVIGGNEGLAGLLPYAYGFVHGWNPNSSAAWVTFKVRDRRGILLTAQTIEIPPRSYKYVSTQNLLPQTADWPFIPEDASIEFEASQPLSLMIDAFGNVLPIKASDSGGYGDSPMAVTEYGHRFHVPHVSMRAGKWETMISIFNAGATDASIRLEARAADGALLGEGDALVSGKGHLRLDGGAVLQSGMLGKVNPEDIATMTITGKNGQKLAAFVQYFAQPYDGKLMAGAWLPPRH